MGKYTVERGLKYELTKVANPAVNQSKRRFKKLKALVIKKLEDWSQ